MAIDEKEFQDLKEKVDKVEEAVNEVDKVVIDLKARGEERDKIINDKLDRLNEKQDKHIALHIRREDAALAAAQAETEKFKAAALAAAQAKAQAAEVKAEEAKEAPEKRRLSRKEKLFYPIAILAAGSLFTLIVWVIQQGGKQ